MSYGDIRLRLQFLFPKGHSFRGGTKDGRRGQVGRMKGGNRRFGVIVPNRCKC